MRFRIAIGLSLSVILLACSDDPEPSPRTAVEEGLDQLTSELDDGILSQINEMTGEQVTLEMQYRTDYDVASWHITDSKTIAFSARLQGEPPAGATVLIENVHVDVALDARRAGVDGLLQDSMDDHLHTGTEAGFLVTAAYPYEEVFAIEGFSETLISGWGFVSGGTGNSEVEEERLTEQHLRESGLVEASKITFVYDVLILAASVQFLGRHSSWSFTRRLWNHCLIFLINLLICLSSVTGMLWAGIFINFAATNIASEKAGH